MELIISPDTHFSKNLRLSSSQLTKGILRIIRVTKKRKTKLLPIATASYIRITLPSKFEWKPTRLSIKYLDQTIDLLSLN
jgi:hypothetical protein